jgi:hypothetical protein
MDRKKQPNGWRKVPEWQKSEMSDVRRETKETKEAKETKEKGKWRYRGAPPPPSSPVSFVPSSIPPSSILPFLH